MSQLVRLKQTGTHHWHVSIDIRVFQKDLNDLILIYVTNNSNTIDDELCLSQQLRALLDSSFLVFPK